MSEHVTPEEIEAFKKAWHKADAEGREGERAADGLAAAYAALTAERDALAAKVARVEALIDDFSNERREHVAGCEGEDTCPACWAEDIAKALAGDA